MLKEQLTITEDYQELSDEPKKPSLLHWSTFAFIILFCVSGLGVCQILTKMEEVPDVSNEVGVGESAIIEEKLQTETAVGGEITECKPKFEEKGAQFSDGSMDTASMLFSAALAAGSVGFGSSGSISTAYMRGTVGSAGTPKPKMVKNPYGLMAGAGFSAASVIVPSLMGPSGPSEAELNSRAISELQSQMGELADCVNKNFEVINQRVERVRQEMNTKFKIVAEAMADQGVQLGIKIEDVKLKLLNKDLNLIKKHTGDLNHACIVTVPRNTKSENCPLAWLLKGGTLWKHVRDMFDNTISHIETIKEILIAANSFKEHNGNNEYMYIVIDAISIYQTLVAAQVTYWKEYHSAAQLRGVYLVEEGGDVLAEAIDYFKRMEVLATDIYNMRNNLYQICYKFENGLCDGYGRNFKFGRGLSEKECSTRCAQKAAQYGRGCCRRISGGFLDTCWFTVGVGIHKLDSPSWQTTACGLTEADDVFAQDIYTYSKIAKDDITGTKIQAESFKFRFDSAYRTCGVYHKLLEPGKTVHLRISGKNSGVATDKSKTAWCQQKPIKVWSDWSECSQTCGRGVQTRRCIATGNNSSRCNDGPLTQTCNTNRCPAYTNYDEGQNSQKCPSGSKPITSVSNCKQAAKTLKLTYKWDVTSPNYPTGCFRLDVRMYWNSYSGNARGGCHVICSLLPLPEPAPVCLQISHISGSYDSEVSWEIKNDNDETLCSRSEQYECCVLEGTYTVHCQDSYGDSWNGYSLSIQGDQVCTGMSRAGSRNDVSTIIIEAPRKVDYQGYLQLQTSSDPKLMSYSLKDEMEKQGIQLGVYKQLLLDETQKKTTRSSLRNYKLLEGPGAVNCNFQNGECWKIQ